MAWLTPQTPTPGTNQGPLTSGILIYLVPFDTARFISCANTLQTGGTGGGGTTAHGFVA